MIVCHVATDDDEAKGKTEPLQYQAAEGLQQVNEMHFRVGRITQSSDWLDKPERVVGPGSTR